MKHLQQQIQILDALQQCTIPQQDIFKRMYPCNSNIPNATLFDYVINIPNHKLDWAYKQIINTITKNQTTIIPPSTQNKTYTINTRDNSIVRLYTHEVIDENNKVVYEGISYEQCMSYIELEELQR